MVFEFIHGRITWEILCCMKYWKFACYKSRHLCLDITGSLLKFTKIKGIEWFYKKNKRIFLLFIINWPHLDWNNQHPIILLIYETMSKLLPWIDGIIMQFHFSFGFSQSKCYSITWAYNILNSLSRRGTRSVARSQQIALNGNNSV